jgi:hypothetical protein
VAELRADVGDGSELLPLPDHGNERAAAPVHQGHRLGRQPGVDGVEQERGLDGQVDDAACWVEMASRPPRSATKSTRHWAGALPSVVRVSMLRPPSPSRARFNVVSRGFV